MAYPLAGAGHNLYHQEAGQSRHGWRTGLADLCSPRKRTGRLVPLPGLLLAVMLLPVCLPVQPARAATDPPVDVISKQDFESPEESPVQSPESSSALPGEPDLAGDAQTATDGIEPFDECDWDLEDQSVQEQTQELVYGVSCHSFRWLDHLFGEELDFPENEVNGIWLLGFDYREYDQFDFRGRFRVRASLPNISKKWDVIAGRENEDEFVSDTAPRERTLFNPGLSRDNDNEWLLGLGHRPANRRRGLDYSLGLRLGSPSSLYGKVQYFYNKQYTEKTNLGFRQTLFWRTDEGLGTTSRANLAHQANLRNVIRWEGVATVSEDVDGMKWYAAQTWYHQLHGKNAISLQAFMRGETDEEVPLRDYGLNLIWRQPFTRDWMFLSMGPNITWPRTFESEERELSLGFSLWVEMEFGDYQY